MGFFTVGAALRSEDLKGEEEVDALRLALAGLGVLIGIRDGDMVRDWEREVEADRWLVGAAAMGVASTSTTALRDGVA